MLAIQKSKSHQGKCTPNILPCRINHNGRVNASKRYWAPTKSKDGKTIAYFRGRKLHGKQIRIPEGYRGVMVSSTDRILPKKDPAQGVIGEEEEEDEEEDVPEVGIMEEEAAFDEIVVWGHEALPDDETDPYVRAMEEWMTFAEQIHSYPLEEKAALKEVK